MAKFRKLNELNDRKEKIAESCWFFCPGCGDAHRIVVQSKVGGPVWEWNGDMEKPTVSPSILVGSANFTKNRCHSFIKEGRIQYLNDCHHKLKGQTVDLPELPDWLNR